VDTSSLQWLLQDLEKVLQKEVDILDSIKKIRQDQLVEVESLKQVRELMNNTTAEELKVMGAEFFNRLNVIEEMTEKVDALKGLIMSSELKK
jgi:vacuolar-type H+-ATPase catalytic subunit A/Vma1